MKVPNQINELNSGPAAGSSLGTARTGGNAPVSSGSPGAAEPGTSGADVHITDTASRLASLEPSLRDAAAIDPARVAAVRSAIEQGQYVVKPEQVAGQLLQMERALGSLRSTPHAPQEDPDTESAS
jgi:flagellar biosynthesis anti-sigma factor FlgM